MSNQYTYAPSAAGRAATLVWMAVAILGCGDDPPAPMTAVDAGRGPVDAASAGRDGGTGPIADASSPATDVAAPPTTDAAGPVTPTPTPGAPDGGAVAAQDPTAAIVVAPITWGTCPDDMDPELPDLNDCARVKVPLDYAKPDGEQIEILVGRLRATDPARRIGSLFLTFGGPGISFGDLASDSEDLSDEIRARFDLVSWDQRGSGASAAVDCKAMPSLPELVRTYDLSPGTTQKDALTAAYAAWVESCKANGRQVPFVGTSASVSDLEILRRAVGDPKLTFVGFSHATKIGLHYLLRYPERVRAMALDGVHAVWPEDAQDDDEAQGFEAALNAFFEWCARASEVDCPFGRENPNRAAAFDALAAAIKLNPVPAPRFPGQFVTTTRLPWAVSAFLFEEFSWPYLGAALERARMAVGNRLWETAENYFGPPGSGEDPFNAMICGDGNPWTAARVDALAAKVTMSRIAVPYERMTCVGWPVANLTPPPGPVPAQVPPVVMIANTGDPVTPYKWTTAAAARLPGSTVITAVAFDHTYYAAGEDCIDLPVDAYLLDLKVPAAGIRCEFPDPIVQPEKTPPDRGTAALATKRPSRRTILRR
jgi:pimeloyl-ACP methyl ester carboxylesterase